VSEFWSLNRIPITISLFLLAVWSPLFILTDPASSEPESDYGCCYRQDYVEQIDGVTCSLFIKQKQYEQGPAAE